MRAGPSGSGCRTRAQTTGSCSGPMAGVVSVFGKGGMNPSGKRCEAHRLRHGDRRGRAGGLVQGRADGLDVVRAWTGAVRVPDGELVGRSAGRVHVSIAREARQADRSERVPVDDLRRRARNEVGVPVEHVEVLARRDVSGPQELDDGRVPPAQLGRRSRTRDRERRGLGVTWTRPRPSRSNRPKSSYAPRCGSVAGRTRRATSRAPS
jgi:hypothetical protein